jgi:hypothetical protein
MGRKILGLRLFATDRRFIRRQASNPIRRLLVGAWIAMRL